MFTAGKFANWIKADVTYAINGFLPMNIVSRVSVDMRVLVFKDNLKLEVEFWSEQKKSAKNWNHYYYEVDNIILEWAKLLKF